MEAKTINKLNDLSTVEFEELAFALRNGIYSIQLGKPTEHNIPEGIRKTFTTRDAYQYILDDPEADFECLTLAFPSGKTSVVVPIGVYGVTAAWQVYFPLQLNSTWRGFIMMSLVDFNAIYRTSGSDDKQSKFALLLKIREELIRRIFSYYYNLDERFNSVMAWAARNPGSPTRKIAEHLMFNRIECGDINNRSEMYLKNDFQGKKDYLIDCNYRWQTVFNEDPTISNVSLSVEKLSRFYQFIVD